MTNIINKVFNLFGLTIMTISDAANIEWERNHWKTSYDEKIKSDKEYRNFVQTNILAGWDETTKNNAELIELNQKLNKLNKDLYAQLHKNTIEKDELLDKALNHAQICCNIINELDSETKASIDARNVILPIQQIVKEGYRHQLADMGVALDRLMGELVSAHGYTEKDIAECLGKHLDSYEHDTPLYDQVQKFMPPFEWKYKTLS